MIDVKEAFPKLQVKTYGLNNCPTYSGILRAFGSLIVEVSENDYQGDTLAIVQSGSKYGYIQFGWGSCSGCDALYGCETIEQLQELVSLLELSIKWFPSLGDLAKWVEEHDWKGDHLRDFLVAPFCTIVKTLGLNQDKYENRCTVYVNIGEDDD